MDLYTEMAAISGKAAGLNPSQWPGLAIILRTVCRDERKMVLDIVCDVMGKAGGASTEQVAKFRQQFETMIDAVLAKPRHFS